MFLKIRKLDLKTSPRVSLLLVSMINLITRRKNIIILRTVLPRYSTSKSQTKQSDNKIN